MSKVNSVLSKPNSVGILVFLINSQGEAKATHISEAMNSNYDAIKNAANRLKDENLITITRYPGKSSYFLYKLTPHGEVVAKDLKRAQDRLDGIDVGVGDVSTDCSAPEEEGDTLGGPSGAS